MWCVLFVCWLVIIMSVMSVTQTVRVQQDIHTDSNTVTYSYRAHKLVLIFLVQGRGGCSSVCST